MRKFLSKALLLLPLFLIAGLVSYRWWNPLFDDGPFYGRPSKIPDRQPNQVFSAGTLRLTVYDPIEKESAPIVACSDKSGKLLWAVRAEAWQGATVSTLRFENWLSIPFTQRRLIGFVDWDYGHEAMWWFLNSDGQLNYYYYSW